MNGTRNSIGAFLCANSSSAINASFVLIFSSVITRLCDYIIKNELIEKICRIIVLTACPKNANIRLAVLVDIALQAIVAFEQRIAIISSAIRIRLIPILDAVKTRRY